MGEFVKHHEQLFRLPKFAVDRNLMPAEHRIIKAAYPQRHLLDHYPVPAAKLIKIILGELLSIPAAFQRFKFVQEEKHSSETGSFCLLDSVSQMGHRIEERSYGN